jgi:hypothetical protein
MNKAKAPDVLTVPLSFRVSPAHLEEIERAARKEVRKYRTELIELIWEWAWKEYRRSGSLRDLLEGTRARRYSRRVSEELQDQLYTALETILDRAPSAVIEDVARLLTARAGKYGDEKQRR